MQRALVVAFPVALLVGAVAFSCGSSNGSQFAERRGGLGLRQRREQREQRRLRPPVRRQRQQQRLRRAVPGTPVRGGRLLGPGDRHDPHRHRLRPRRQPAALQRLRLRPERDARAHHAGQPRVHAVRGARLRLAHHRHVDRPRRQVHAREGGQRRVGRPRRQQRRQGHPARPPGRQVAQAARHPERDPVREQRPRHDLQRRDGDRAAAPPSREVERGRHAAHRLHERVRSGRVLPPPHRHRRQRVRRSERAEPGAVPRDDGRRGPRPLLHGERRPERPERRAPSPAATRPRETYQWWTDSKNLLAYDIIFNACECNPNDRGATAYGAMDVVPQGRRAPLHDALLRQLVHPDDGHRRSAERRPVGKRHAGTGGTRTSRRARSTRSISRSRRGRPMRQWLQDNGISTSLGNITLADLRDDILAPKPAGCSANQSCLSTQWIYNPGNMHPRYLSFNTPVGTPVAQQCGRAVYSDVHLSGVERRPDVPGGVQQSVHRQPAGPRHQREGARVSLLRPLVLRAERHAAASAAQPGAVSRRQRLFTRSTSLRTYGSVSAVEEAQRLRLRRPRRARACARPCSARGCSPRAPRAGAGRPTLTPRTRARLPCTTTNGGTSRSHAAMAATNALSPTRTNCATPLRPPNVDASPRRRRDRRAACRSRGRSRSRRRRRARRARRP